MAHDPHEGTSASRRPPCRVLLHRSARSGAGAIIAVDSESDAVEVLESGSVVLDGPARVTLDVARLRGLEEDAISSLLRGIQKLRAAEADLVVLYERPSPLDLDDLRRLLERTGGETPVRSRRCD